MKSSSVQSAPQVVNPSPAATSSIARSVEPLPVHLTKSALRVLEAAIQPVAGQKKIPPGDLLKHICESAELAAQQAIGLLDARERSPKREQANAYEMARQIIKSAEPLNEEFGFAYGADALNGARILCDQLESKAMDFYLRHLSDLPDQAKDDFHDRSFSASALPHLNVENVVSIFHSAPEASELWPSRDASLEPTLSDE